MKNLWILAMAVTLAACHGYKTEGAFLDRFEVSDNLSSQRVNAFAEDSRGYIWIGTQRGLDRFNGQTYNHYSILSDSLGNSDYTIYCLKTDRQDNLWVGTIQGLYLYRYGDRARKIDDHFITMVCDASDDYLICGSYTYVLRIDKHSLDCSPIHDFTTNNSRNMFLTDRNGKLWTFEEKGIGCTDIKSGKPEGKIFSETKCSIALSLGETIYVYTEQGFFELDIDRRTLTQTEQLKELSQTFQSDKVQKMFAFGSKSFLIQTGTGKLFLYDTANAQLLSGEDDRFPFRATDSEITDVFVDSHDNIWIGKKWQGYSVNYSRQAAFNRNQRISSFFAGRVVTDLHLDQRGNLWVITDNKDVYLCDKDRGISLVYSYGSRDLMRIHVDCKDNVWLSCSEEILSCRLSDKKLAVTNRYDVLPLFVNSDDSGNVFAGSIGEVYRKMADEKEFKPVGSLDGEKYNIVKFAALPDGKVAALDIMKGLYIIDGNRQRSVNQNIFGHLEKRTRYLDMTVDKNGKIWIASVGNGILSVDASTDIVIKYDSDEYCHDACSIVEDESGKIWVGTFDGLTLLDPKTGNIKTFYTEDNIAGNDFSHKCAVRTPDGILLFGGTNGITSFDPEEINVSSDMTLQMEYLTVGGEQVQDLTVDADVDLDYNNAGVDFSFTTLNYGGSAPACQYKMEGFDPKWSTTRKTEHAYYSHLPVGKYVLRIRTAGKEGEYLDRVVKVKVHPSFWWLPVMKWLVYPLLTLIVLSTLVYWFHRRRLTVRRLRAVTQEKEQEQRANELNMRFFSNISHEFRTPLTLISGALAMIKTNSNDRSVGILRRSTERMIRMVNQLMDFNKMENGMLRLAVSEADINNLVSQTASMFEMTAAAKQISLQLHLLEPPVKVWVDTDKLEKILVNLISNAIKYSGEGSSVTVSLSLEGGMLKVDVADTGVGIPEDKREEIFMRFYQLKRTGQAPNIGTGIGLYYVRSLVELHHGQIKCLGNEPQGSVFTFSIPVEENAYSKEEISRASITLNVGATVTKTEVVARPLPDMEIIETTEVNGEQSATRLMIVDDDPEVLNFLQLMLSPHYQTHPFRDASTAYSEIENLKPDLILSDVMMEEIDGYKFCRMVKDNSSICHIPVILLTAKSALEEQIQGLSCGASAYVTKPFSPEYLLAMIKSQLDNVRSIQQSLNKSTTVTPAVEKTLQAADTKFMQTFYAYIDEHLSDSELKLDELTLVMCMSRTKFFYKFKSLTGETPNVFFKTYKLNRAAEMILKGDEKIVYIADILGFSSAANFSTSFKKQFNCTPSEYKQQHQ